jgi:WD40 repeat protein
MGGPLNALSMSPDKTMFVIGGREVLKVIQLEREEADGPVFVLEEVVNLRVGKLNLSFSGNDVKWHPSPEYKHYIATAATNGAVVLWNLQSKGKKMGT